MGKMIEEVFVETCWEDEAIARQRRDARRAELEAMGLKCRSEDCYRITDWRWVFVVIAETPEVDPIPVLREKKVLPNDRSILRGTQASNGRQLSSMPNRKQSPVHPRKVRYETR